jgi:hypothetical protein
MQIPGFTLSANAEDVPWRSTRVAGVQWYLLATEGPPDGATAADGGSVLIRMEPGCGYPPHRHLDLEEVLVLAGGYQDEEGTHRAGDYVRYPAGSAHAPVALGETDAPLGPLNPACVLFASARGGIEQLDL